MYKVYVIYNHKNDKFYIGQTNNLPLRLILHNNKSFNHCYTAKFNGKWEVVYEENVADRKDALKRERQLKSCQGRQFVKNLILFPGSAAVAQLAVNKNTQLP